jgi:hypothetical protein
MATVINKAIIKHPQEQAFVDGIITLVTEQGFDGIQIVRSPTCFGAQAKPYKVSKRNGKSLFKLNLGSCYPSYPESGVDYRPNRLIDYTPQIEKFITSAKVEKFLEDTA